MASKGKSKTAVEKPVEAATEALTALQTGPTSSVAPSGPQDPEPRPLERITGFPPKRYRTQGARVLAYTDPGPAPDYVQSYLMKTALNNFFIATRNADPTKDDISPVVLDQAIRVYGSYPNQTVPFPSAFPGYNLGDA